MHQLASLSDSEHRISDISTAHAVAGPSSRWLGSPAVEVHSNADTEPNLRYLSRHGESNPEPCRPSGRQGGPANGCLRAAIWRKSYHIRLPIDGEGAGTATAAETAATATRETVEIEPGDNPSCSPISRTALEAAFACA